MTTDWVILAAVTTNAAAAVACAVGYYREWSRRTVAEAERAAALATVDGACREASWAAAELVALRKTNASLLEHVGRMGERNKLLAVELKVGDGTKKTEVWRDRKPEVWQP